MKNLIISLFILSATLQQAFAQSSEAIIKEKMKIFSAWTGEWNGKGSMRMGGGEPKTSEVKEQVESKLDGTIIVMEGIGKSRNEKTQKDTVVHHAFGVLSFDPQSNQYKLKTFLKDGRSTDAWFNVTGTNSYQWGFETPKGKIRYNISIDPVAKIWKESGEFSSDGNQWWPFFEMNLAKAN